MARKQYKRLRYEDRRTIEKMLKAGNSVVAIAAELEVHRDTIYKLGEIFDKTSKDIFKNVKWLFTLLINEARLADDENAELLTEEKVGRMITAGNMGEIQNAIYAAFAKGAAGDAAAGEEDEEDDEEGETKAGQDS